MSKTAHNFILATAGHVDHGKSSLTKALTGIDPDRLPEEKKRGITIDLGFAHLDLPGKVGSFHLGIVDVPGHEDFVKNMVAGVGSIDLALLIVAADDGWMPQTEEHLQILTYLGVTHGVVALTKIDLAVDERAVEESIREKLAGSPLAHAPIVPTSIISGRGLMELKSALAETLEQMPPPRDIGKPRLPVDRVFVLRGIGTVATGTLNGGRLRRSEEIIIQPSGQRTRIRSVQNHNQDVGESGPGTRTALNIPDVKGTGGSPGLHRGDIITLPDLGGVSTELDVLIVKSARTAGTKSPDARTLKNGSRVRIHLGSRDTPARVVLLDSRGVEPGGRALAHLSLEAPVFAFAGDRFIVRDWPEQTTLAGGVVLDPDPPRERLKSEARRHFLETRAQAPSDALAFVASQARRFRATVQSGLLVKSRFSAAEVSEAVHRLVAAKKLFVAGEYVVDLDWWNKLRAEAISRIDSEHRDHPNRVGFALADLKAALEMELPGPQLFNVLLEDLLQTGFSRSGLAIKRSSHQLTLPPALQTAGQRVRRILSAKPVDPPSRKEVTPDESTRLALQFLLETGEAILLAEDVVLLSDAYQSAREVVKNHLLALGAATASELRQALGTSRRVLIPLLEQLDRDGVTRREGDKRVLVAAASRP